MSDYSNIQKYYGQMFPGFNPNVANEIKKGTYTPLQTSDGGILNDIFGPKVWDQLNTETTLYNLIRKVTPKKTGWRARTARNASPQYIAENADIPDSGKQTRVQMAADFKILAATFHVSRKLEVKAKFSDSIGDVWAEEVREGTMDMENKWNQMMYGTYAEAGADAADVLTGLEFIVEKYISTLGDYDASVIYNQTRGSGKGYLDAVVNYNTDVGRGTLRKLTEGMLDSQIDTLENNGAQIDLIVTSREIRRKMNKFVEAKQRFTGAQDFKIKMNGEETVPGARGGFRLATWEDKPIFTDVNCPSDTIYFLDTRYLEQWIAQPAFLEMKPQADKFGKRGAMSVMNELVCTSMSRQGKIVDINPAL